MRIYSSSVLGIGEDGSGMSESLLKGNYNFFCRAEITL